MFGPDAERIFAELPKLKRLSGRQAQRTLSTLYLDLFATKSAAQRETGPDTNWCVAYARRLANALESYAIFDSDVSAELKAGAAFVAAEALSLLVEMTPHEAIDDCYYRLDHPRTYTAVEAALLYLVAGFDANAAVLMDSVPAVSDSGRPLLCTPHAERALDTISIFCGKSKQLTQLPEIGHEQIEAHLELAARAALFRGIGDAVWQFVRWRSGHNDDGFQSAVDNLEHLHELLRSKEHNHKQVQHLLRLIMAAVVATGARAIRNVPTPPTVDEENYRPYLISRARGGPTGQSRPVLWPSAVRFVEQCLPGPHCNSVVSIPTGSGKSFIAELALSQVLNDGWAIYLVPTNALANQVRMDLDRAFHEFPGIEVRAFFGGEEYTTLGNEDVAGLGAGVVAVMTPEKCALALRLSPAAFRNCQLCIFDECHLIGDGTRGVLAELVLSHVIALAPDCRVILMSALVANTGELAEWLTNSTGRITEVVDEPWRPTRSMRGVVAVDREQATINRQAALDKLRSLIASGKKRKFIDFDAPHVVLASLQGPWTSARTKEYAQVSLPTSISLSLDRLGRRASGGWVNSSAAVLTSYFGSRNLPVLTFLPGSKHFPFSVGANVLLENGVVESLSPNSLVTALQTISRYELGTDSAVEWLLAKGVAVHTAALIDSEKLSSEIAFQTGMAKVMMATGTLAQGLNLPTSVVIVAGTAIGDAREALSPEGITRSRSQLLNALGRAGRAGVSNHGIGLVITQEPLFLGENFEPQSVTQAAEFLAQQENSTPVTSKLESFVRDVLSGELDILTATPEELVAFSYLPVERQEGISSSDILARSFAFQKRPAIYRQAEAEQAATTLAELGASFIDRTGAPTWITNVAYKTGLPFVFCLQLLQARSRILLQGQDNLPDLTSYDAWVEVLFRILQVMPPQSVHFVLGKEMNNCSIDYLWKELPVVDSADWEPPVEWYTAWDSARHFVSGYMRGDTISALAIQLLGLTAPIDSGRSTGSKPIPKVLKFLRTALENISRTAGALACIEDEIALEQQNSGIIPISLSDKAKLALVSLPLAIKNGFDDISGLQWYRFGIRYRRPAHLLARLFPLPDGGEEDDSAQIYVKRTMAGWIDGTVGLPNHTADEMAILEATKIVVAR